MRDNYKDIEDNNLYDMLDEIINNILYETEFKQVELFAYSSILSDILNVFENSELTLEGNFVPGCHLEKWTEDVELTILEKRFDDFLDMIKKELLREERYEVLSMLKLKLI